MSSTRPYVDPVLPDLSPTRLQSPSRAAANFFYAQSETFSSMTTQLKGSAGRLGRMAASGNKVAVFKLSAIVVGVFLVLYYLLKWMF